jgi:AraC-like DNA-binding protein
VVDNAWSVDNLADPRLEKNDTRATDNPKGILDPAARRFDLRRHPPPAALAPWIEYLWVVEWDRRDRPPVVQRVLPYPNAHLVFEAGRTAVHGVVRGPFDKVLAGQGRALGLRFRPGGLRPLLGGPVSALTGRIVPLDRLFGIDGGQAERRVLDQPDDAGMIAAACDVLAPVLVRAPADSRIAMAERAVAAASAQGGPVSVAGLAQAAGLPERGLQRLFRDDVGVPPKWVVQRFRLQEAAAALARPEAPDLAALALALGFFDQAHLTRAFTALVGRAPLEYWRSQAG